MIQDIRLQQFRSYTDDSFEFGPGVNIIVGPNASGKTNLLEAILVVARGGSYRVRDSELIMFEHPWARLDSLVDNAERTVKLIREPLPEKQYELDGRIFRRLGLKQALPVVLFEPNHLSLLTGSPEGRRAYLDELLTQTTPGYGSTVRAYRRTLAQRNRLLKKGAHHVTTEQLFPWNVRLSELGATIARARTDLAETINRTIDGLYRELSHTQAIATLVYGAMAAPEEYESHMLRQLELRTHDDLLRGFTSFGPHREDVLICFDGRPASETVSRGETRTLVLGLKIIELEQLKQQRGETPLLLLDDVFSELDGARRKHLTTHLQSYQTFITTTDADVVLQHFTDQSNILLVSR